ncbi:MAG: hypothetical protein ABW252_17105 [Polyangiales bacterium]
MRTRPWCAALCCLSWAACVDESSEGVDTRMRAAPEVERAAEAATSEEDPSLLYVVDPRTGSIVQELPPAVLRDILARLERGGMKREAEHARRLYDLTSGRVRDPSRVAHAEARLRARGTEREVRHVLAD